MGGRSSPGIFNFLTDTVEWTIKNAYVPYLCHFLDRFLSEVSQIESGWSLKFILRRTTRPYDAYPFYSIYDIS